MPAPIGLFRSETISAFVGAGRVSTSEDDSRAKFFSSRISHSICIFRNGNPYAVSCRTALESKMQKSRPSSSLPPFPPCMACSLAWLAPLLTCLPAFLSLCLPWNVYTDFLQLVMHPIHIGHCSIHLRPSVLIRPPSLVLFLVWLVLFQLFILAVQAKQLLSAAKWKVQKPGSSAAWF